MHPQLDRIVDELETSRARLHRLVDAVSAPRWGERPDSDAWSVGECVAHLNLSSSAVIPILRVAVDEARRLGTPAPRRYRRDPLGWILWKTLPPPVRTRTKTPAPFIPAGTAPAADVVRDFDRLQDELVALVRACDGLPIQRVRVASPFYPKIRYNLFSCLTIQAPHQERHLWQAEQVAERLR